MGILRTGHAGAGASVRRWGCSPSSCPAQGGQHRAGHAGLRPKGRQQVPSVQPKPRQQPRKGSLGRQSVHQTLCSAPTGSHATSLPPSLSPSLPHSMCYVAIAHQYRGGGLWHFNFVRNFASQIDREISHTKLRVLRVFLAHPQYTLWTLAGEGGGWAKFTTVSLTWREIPCTPCHTNSHGMPQPRPTMQCRRRSRDGNRRCVPSCA